MDLARSGVTAASDGRSYLMRFSGTDAHGSSFLCVDLVQGTWGARSDKDGVDGLANIQANHANTPIEVVEANFPMRVESHTFVPDAEGPGEFRGGLALERSWRYLGTGEGGFRSRADRSRFPPYGLFGGGFGALGRLVLERPGEEPVVLGHKAVIKPPAGRPDPSSARRRGRLGQCALAGSGGGCRRREGGQGVADAGGAALWLGGAHAGRQPTLKRSVICWPRGTQLEVRSWPGP